jgi:hypothetical protein
MSSSFAPRAVRLPGPCRSIFRNPCREAERFTLYDISGRQVGTYKGDRVGEGLAAGIYLLSSGEEGSKPVKIVKIQ